MAMGFIDNVFSDYLWARGVLLTTPAVVTCGVALQACREPILLSSSLSTVNSRS